MFPHQLLVAFGLSLLISLPLFWHLRWWALIVLGLTFIPILPKNLRAAIGSGIIISCALSLGYLNYFSQFPLWPEGTHLQISGVVIDDVISSTPRATTIRVQAPNLNNVPIRISTYDQAPLRYGDSATFDLIIAPKPQHSGTLLKDKIFHQADVVGISNVQPPKTWMLRRQLFDLRDHLASFSQKFLPREQANLLNGLLFGLRHSLDTDFAQALRHSGTTHIIALSGYNIAVVITCFLWLLAPLPRRLGLIVSGLAIILFVLMTGASSSVVRAGIMGCALLMAGLLGRRRHLGVSIVLAATIMTIINPLSLLYDLGFQLSLIATCGIVFISPLIARRLSILKFDWLIQLLAATSAATLATLPLLLFYFQGLSIVGVISNLIVVPLVPIAMGLGGIGLLVVTMSDFLIPLAILAQLPLTLITKSVNFFGHLPGSFVATATLSPLVVTLAYLLLIAIIIQQSRRHPHA